METFEPDPLFIGLTKPPMKMGIPMEFFMITFFISVLSFLFLLGVTQNLIISVAVPVVFFFSTNAYAKVITVKDHFGLEIKWINLRYFPYQSSFRFWKNTNSYSW